MSTILFAYLLTMRAIFKKLSIDSILLVEPKTHPRIRLDVIFFYLQKLRFYMIIDYLVLIGWRRAAGWRFVIQQIKFWNMVCWRYCKGRVLVCIVITCRATSLKLKIVLLMEWAFAFIASKLKRVSHTLLITQENSRLSLIF